MGFMSDSYKGHSALNRTPGQQRNVQAKQAEDNRYKTQARLGGAAGRVNTPAQGKRNMQPPTAPSAHPVVAQNTRQFSSPSQGMRGALTRVRTATRLGKLLKKR